MMQFVFSSNKGADQLHDSLHDELALFHVEAHSKSVLLETSSPKGNDRSPDNKQVFLNSSQVSKRFFQLVKGS